MNINGLWRYSLWSGLSYKVGFLPPNFNDIDIKNGKRFTVKSTSRPSLRWLLCSCFLFFSICFVSKGACYTHIYQTKGCKEIYPTYIPSTTLLLTKPAGSLFSEHLQLHCGSLSSGDTAWFCSFQKNYATFLILQQLCISSKKEQQNDEAQEMEEFNHML